MTERGTSGSTSNPPAGANVTAGAMTVDVEDYFQVAALSQQIRREDWDSHPCRVERNVDRILGLFSESGVSATFFTLGRSEEHTSELQSLMRISYAVFCL